MNTKRLLLAWIAVVAAVFVFDMIIYHYAGLARFHEDNRVMLRTDASELRMALVGALTWAFVSVLYALFARGRASRISTGLVFGVLLGFIAGWIPQAWMKLMIANWPFYPWWAAMAFGEFVLAGIVLGAIYRE